MNVRACVQEYVRTLIAACCDVVSSIWQSLCTGKDVVGLAQTGSGKTGTFAIPIIQALLKHVQPFFALVVAPARELAIQIAETFESLGSGIGLKSCVLVGGIDMMQQALVLGKRPHVLVGTPGRIIDHLSNTKGFSLKVGIHRALNQTPSESRHFDAPPEIVTSAGSKSPGTR